MAKPWHYLVGRISELGSVYVKSKRSKFPCSFSVKKGTSQRYTVFVHFYHNAWQSLLSEIHFVLSSNFEFIRRIVDLNYLRTSDKFIQFISASKRKSTTRERRFIARKRKPDRLKRLLKQRKKCKTAKI
jgi:hypothetical protein